jgi:hypothetical protein
MPAPRARRAEAPGQGAAALARNCFSVTAVGPGKIRPRKAASRQFLPRASRNYWGWPFRGHGRQRSAVPQEKERV